NAAGNVIRTITSNNLIEFPTLRARQLFTSGNTRIRPLAAGVVAASQFNLLSIPQDSRFDLTNNDLQITGGNNYIEVAAWISNGLRGQDPTTLSGSLLSSNAQADRTHALGEVTGAEYKRIAARTTFDGLPVSDGDVLVKYTIGGDANLDGKLNIDDYNQI